MTLFSEQIIIFWRLQEFKGTAIGCRLQTFKIFWVDMECYASSNHFFHLIPLLFFESIAIMTFKVQLGNHLLTALTVLILTGIGHLVMNMWNWSNFISAREGGVIPVMSILVCIAQASIPQFLSEGALIPIVNLISYTASSWASSIAQSRYAVSRTGRPAAIYHILRAWFP